MRRAVILMILLALSGCGAVRHGRAASDAEGAIRRSMRDPESTTFRDVFSPGHANQQVVCGEVNSANGFGGKTGYRRFISTAGTVNYDPATDQIDARRPPPDVSKLSNEERDVLKASSEFEMAWNSTCKRPNQPV